MADVLTNKLALMHVLSNLKTQKRTGWVRKEIQQPESIADHMYRMAMLALLSEEDSDLDVQKCVALAVVHDLAEAEVGDITPFDGITPHEKQRLETAAMERFLTELLPSDSNASKRIRSLWEEYETRSTKEARFVKDLDRFELGLQADEYEKGQHLNLQEFFDSTQPKIEHPEVKQWSDALMAARKPAA